MAGSPEGNVSFGRYRLGRLLGRGGMGEVYLARDTALDRDVAIKFVAPDRAADGEARRRLLREAHAAAALDHPYICTVYDTGETPDGRAYIAMQYVEGESLGERLRRGPLRPREALELAAHIAEALAAAHAHRVVHRDLKPTNVLVTPTGRPKLVDFGIAKVVLLPGDSPTAPDGTASGTLIGTASYMSPEQVQQRPLDGRSDLFSLGVLLYESLTGRRPFDGRTSIETIINILHLDPPAVSTIAPALGSQHDEICRRLLEKEPDDRFQSAEEVVGALRVLVGGSRTEPIPAPPWWTRLVTWLRRRRREALTSAAAVILATVAVMWLRPGVPRPPPEAEAWYLRGTRAIRQGSYVTASRALERAVLLYPDYFQAHARLAEASAELDDPSGASDRLLRVANLVPDEGRLPAAERLRLQALRLLVLRQLDESIAIYEELARRFPEDPGVWMDLGRAQEAAGSSADARTSYQQAIEQDRQHAVAYLRLGSVEGLEYRREAALRAFAEAERLYRAASDIEGETEVLLRRGAMLDAFTEVKEARADVERALTLSRASDITYQRVRAILALSSITASSGNFAEAEHLASAAIEEAGAAGLDAIAADGLVELAATLAQAERLDDADREVTRAMRLADQRRAQRAGARARVQLAVIREKQRRPEEALAVLEEVLPYLRANRYRRFEFYAQLTAARAYEQMDSVDEARRASAEVLALAEAQRDDGQIAFALSNLANVLTSLGTYPEATRLRERAESILRRQGDQAALPFQLANRAELLILQNRGEEAQQLLAELEAGIEAGIESYVGRTRRVEYLRTLAAVVHLRCVDAKAHAARVGRTTGPADASGLLAAALASFCDARTDRRVPASSDTSPAPPAVARERQYWVAAAALERGDYDDALRAAARGLQLVGELPHDELRWRLAAVGSAAATHLGDEARRTELAALAHRTTQSLAAAWPAEYERYAQRPDLARLQALAVDGATRPRRRTRSRKECDHG